MLITVYNMFVDLFGKKVLHTSMFPTIMIAQLNSMSLCVIIMLQSGFVVRFLFISHISERHTETKVKRLFGQYENDVFTMTP